VRMDPNHFAESLGLVWVQRWLLFQSSGRCAYGLLLPAAKLGLRQELRGGNHGDCHAGILVDYTPWVLLDRYSRCVDRRGTVFFRCG